MAIISKHVEYKNSRTCPVSCRFITSAPVSKVSTKLSTVVATAIMCGEFIFLEIPPLVLVAISNASAMPINRLLVKLFAASPYTVLRNFAVAWNPSGKAGNMGE